MRADDKDFNRLRAQFSRRANAREIPALASKLGWWIAYGRMDVKRRSTFVTQRTLAGDLGGVAVRTVQRMIDVLKPLGLNVAPGHGPDKASTYWIGEVNTTSMSPIDADNTTSMSPIQPSQGDTRVGSTRHLATEKATPVSRHIKNSKKISKKVSNKSPAVSAAGRTTDDARDSIPTNSATTSADAPSGPAFDTVDDATVPATERPSARPASEAAGLKQPDPQNQPAPSIASKNIGRPADSARAAFEDVRFAWPTDRTDDGAYAAYVAALAAAQGDTEAILDAIWERLEESGAGPPWLSDALRRIEHDLRYGRQ